MMITTCDKCGGMRGDPNEMFGGLACSCLELPAELRSSGVHIYWDDELILHASFAKRPENQEEMIAMLKYLIEVMETPSVPCCDCQVLGQANCPVHNL